MLRGCLRDSTLSPLISRSSYPTKPRLPIAYSIQVAVRGPAVGNIFILLVKPNVMNLSEFIIFLNSAFSAGSLLLSMELKGEILAIISALAWAGSASIYKKGLEGIDPWSGNLIRTGFASLGFFLILIIKGTLSESLLTITLSLLFWLIFSAFFAFFLGDLLFFTSLKEIGVSRTVPISSTYPLFVTAWAFIIYRKPVSIFVIVGTLFIVLAIKLISGEEKDKNSKDNAKKENNPHSKGILLALLAALCWSISITVLEHLVLYLPSEAVAGFRFLITFSLMAAVGSQRKFTITRRSVIWIGIFGMAVLVIGNYTFLEGIRLIGSAKVAPISSVYPVISVLFATIFLRETLTPKIIGGTIMSFLGVLLIVLG